MSKTNPQKAALRFLRSLRRHNDRVWFGEHKEEYKAVKEGIDLLTNRFLAMMTRFEPQAALLSPADCTYRIYRDTRFSSDKTPYKTHIGIFICPPEGKKSMRSGYYLHIEPGNSFAGGGVWCPDSDLLRRLRREIFDNVEEYLEITGGEFGKEYPEIGSDRLKTAPKGFPKDWEHIDLIKPKDYTFYHPLTDEEVESDSFPDTVIHLFELQKPLHDFYNYVFEP